MARPKVGKCSARLSVTLDERDCLVIKEMAEAMGLSAAWVIRRAVSEFVARHQGSIEEDIALKLLSSDEEKKKT